MVSSMNKHRSAGGVVAFQGYIYALGGHDGLSIFDSVSNKLLSNILQNFNYSKIHLSNLKKKTQVEKYDALTDTWTNVQPMLSRRCRLGVAALNGKLYVCGGYDGSTFLKSVEAYDPKTNK